LLWLVSTFPRRIDNLSREGQTLKVDVAQCSGASYTLGI
jgi:hypothetical protein